MNEPINLGGLERPRDERDFPLDDILGAADAGSRPISYKPDISWFIRNYQGQQPACSTHAGSHLKMLLDYYINAVTDRKNPRYGWIKLKDPSSPVCDHYTINQGSDMRSIFKLMQTLGSDDFEPLENDVTLSETDYANPTAVTNDMDMNAALSKIGSYAFGGTTYEGLCAEVWKAKAVILLIKCDEGFWHTTEPTFTTPKYGHFVVMFGYDETGIWVIDSADPDDANAVKHIATQYIVPEFVLEAGTAINLPPSVHLALTKGQKDIALQILSDMGKILEIDLQWIKSKTSSASAVTATTNASLDSKVGIIAKTI